MTQVSFALFYIIAMIPTYILPYFGSNSFIAQGVMAAATHTGLGLIGTVLHLAAYGVLVYAASARGKATGKAHLMWLPIIAGVFDFIPVLSAIPLVPTVLNVIALVLGVTAKDTAQA